MAERADGYVRATCERDADELGAYLDALLAEPKCSRGSDAAPRARADLPRARPPGAAAAAHGHAAACRNSCSRARIDGGARRLPRCAGRAEPGGRRVVGPLRRLPGTRRPRGVPRVRARARDPHQPVPSAIPDATVARGARGARAARARRELRGRRAGARRGHAARALPRGRSDARPPAEPPAPPRRPAAIDLDDIQGNVLRGYTMPAAAYLWLRIVDVAEARALMRADAAAGGDRGAVGRRRRRPR